MLASRLRPNIQQRVKRSMDQRTLGLENLGLEEPAAPHSASRENKEKGNCAEDKPSLHSESQQTPCRQTSSLSSRDLSAVPSYQPLPIAPLGSSADKQNHWPFQIHHHGFVQNSAVDRYHPVQFSVSAGLAPIYGPTILRASGDPFVKPSLHSRSPGFTEQKSVLSVLTYRGHPSSRVDKQYRDSKANPPLTGLSPDQRRRWTDSTPNNVRKAVSQPSRSSQSTKTKHLETTPSANHRHTSLKDDLIHLPAPTPTSAYLSYAHAIPNLLSSPQRLLLVLDLNGTLLYRARASQNYTPRPCLSEFLKYSFANHSLLVWSSAQPYNVKGVCTRLFSRSQREMLLGEWGRDTLGLTPSQYKERVQVYKRLDRIWDNENLQHSHPGFEGGERWGQHNTLLIDDSALKASAQPFNHVEVPEFVRGGREEGGDGRDVLGQVVEYLEEARKWSNVSGFVKHGRFEIDAEWRRDWQQKRHGRDQCGDDEQDGGVRL